MKMHYLKNVATLELNMDKCTGCGICLDVCPHSVLGLADKKAVILDRDACMECGACSMNCPFEAISVDSGVGCAQALLRASITGGEATCGCSGDKGGACC